METPTICTTPEEGLGVKTALNDGQNITVVGTRIEIDLQKEEEWNEDQVHATVTSPIGSIVTETTKKDDGTLSVHFTPDKPEKLEIAVKHQGQAIPGSPYFLTVLEKPATTKRSPSPQPTVSMESSACAVVEKDQQVNVVLPAKETGVVVEGPLGSCKYLAGGETEGAKGLRFVPKVVGEYHVQTRGLGGGEILRMVALGDASSASKCHVLEEDSAIFKKSQRFGKGLVSFRVSTKDAGKGKLEVVSHGPEQATISVEQEGQGIERCEFTPSVPGHYKLDVVWNGQHIEGSPLKLKFRQPKSRIGSGGLDLHNVSYHVGRPYQFRLDCREAGEGLLNLVCTPSSAAKVSVSQSSTAPYYQCEILPLETGTHKVALFYKGSHISGSPFRVDFKGRIDPSKCLMIRSSDSHRKGGKVSLQVSTKGAGEGDLTAAAVNTDTMETIPTAITQLEKNLHKLEIEPGHCSECDLRVRFEGYDIEGSPFRLQFWDQSTRCEAEGPGLVSALTGMKNKFTVRTVESSIKKLAVVVEGEEGVGEVVKPTVSEAPGGDDYEVSYTPMTPGNYKVSVTWDGVHVPSSPFTVPCQRRAEASLLSVQVPKDTMVHVGKEFNFSVMPTEKMAKGTLRVEAVSRQGHTVEGEAKQNGEYGSYACTVRSTVVGKFEVHVFCDGEQVQGSPFLVKVITPPQPDKVKAYGPGLANRPIGRDSSFTIDATEGGTGVLSVRVHGPKGAFVVNTSKDPQNERSVLVNYNPMQVGKYKIDIAWSGTAIPGSPFVVWLKRSSLPSVGIEEEEEEVRSRSSSDGERGESITQTKIGTTKEGEQDTIPVVFSSDGDGILYPSVELNDVPPSATSAAEEHHDMTDGPNTEEKKEVEAKNGEGEKDDGGEEEEG